MAQYRVSGTIDGKHIAQVRAKLAQVFFGEPFTVEKITDQSRADRLATTESEVSDAASEVRDLESELQEWYDNLPESLQSGYKGDALQEAIDSLQTIADALESIDWGVDFPGMYD